MKTEFLQNLKIGDQALTKEIIDAILAENGRDVEAAKKPFADYEAIKEQLKTAKDGLKAFEGVDVNDLQSKITTLQNDLSAKDKEYQQKLADMQFDGLITDTVRAAKGKNAKAIRALLDIDVLKSSKNQADDVKKALEALKKDNGYLFEDEQKPPFFAPGPGSQTPPNTNQPTGDSLVGALRERYNTKG